MSQFDKFDCSYKYILSVTLIPHQTDMITTIFKSCRLELTLLYRQKNPVIYRVYSLLILLFKVVRFFVCDSSLNFRYLIRRMISPF